MSACELLVGAFDGTSRIPGAALGAMRLLAAFREIAPQAFDRGGPTIVRELTKNSAMWCRRLAQLIVEDDFKLMLGGEHLVTFPILEALVRRHENLRLVVLDAHHDAYEHPLLTHWSLFHFAIAELAIPTLIVGARHELPLANPSCAIVPAEEVRRDGVDAALRKIDDFVCTAPFYFSLDVDVVDPSEFGAVSDPVRDGLSITDVTFFARALLSRRPVGADIVEYNALRDPDSGAIGRLHPLLEEYARWFTMAA